MLHKDLTPVPLPHRGWEPLPKGREGRGLLAPLEVPGRARCCCMVSSGGLAWTRGCLVTERSLAP